MKRIVIIGNAGGGKSKLAHSLGDVLGLPVHHMDSLWETEDCERRSDQDINADILRIAEQPTWIIEGWMPFSGIPLALDRADTIVYIKHRLYIHIWWTLKREVKERVFGVSAYESHCGRGPFITKMMRVVFGIWKTYQPKMLKMVEPYRSKKSVIDIRSPHELRQFLEEAGRAANSPNQSNP
jgi:hypothetical protein